MFKPVKFEPEKLWSLRQSQPMITILQFWITGNDITCNINLIPNRHSESILTIFTSSLSNFDRNNMVVIGIVYNEKDCNDIKCWWQQIKIVNNKNLTLKPTENHFLNVTHSIAFSMIAHPMPHNSWKPNCTCYQSFQNQFHGQKLFQIINIIK